MVEDIDICKLQTDEEIKELYEYLNADLYKNNSSFFHLSEIDLEKCIRKPHCFSSMKFNRFKRNWENFNTHKQALFHFFYRNSVNYPSIFGDSDRVCIKKIHINFDEILSEINILRIKKIPISYSYNQIITKLVYEIVTTKLLLNQQLLVFNIDILKNKIEIEYTDIPTQKYYIKTFKLNKFLYKYQSIYPDLYKNISAWLIVSKNWKDIFLSSTCKQWNSCMNMVNTYKDHIIKYSNENYVKSR